MHIYWKDPNDNCKIEKCGNHFISNIKKKYDIQDLISKLENNFLMKNYGVNKIEQFCPNIQPKQFHDNLQEGWGRLS